MKNIKIVIAFLLVLTSLGYAGGSKMTLVAGGTVTNSNPSRVTVSTTYAASNVDTVVITRDAALSALAFGVHASDSASIANIVVRRAIDGKLQALVTATDSLQGLFGWNTVADSAITYNLLLNNTTSGGQVALADAYWVFITYKSTGNGVTSPTVKYEAIKQYAYKQN